MSELLDRITAMRKHAEGRMERATFQAELREWKDVVRLLEDVRDELNKPIITPIQTVIYETPKTLTLKGKAA